MGTKRPGSGRKTSFLVSLAFVDISSVCGVALAGVAILSNRPVRRQREPNHSPQGLPLQRVKGTSSPSFNGHTIWPLPSPFTRSLPLPFTRPLHLLFTRSLLLPFTRPLPLPFTQPLHLALHQATAFTLHQTDYPATAFTLHQTIRSLPFTKLSGLYPSTNSLSSAGLRFTKNYKACLLYTSDAADES